MKDNDVWDIIPLSKDKSLLVMNEYLKLSEILKVILKNIRYVLSQNILYRKKTLIVKRFFSSFFKKLFKDYFNINCAF
jgi:hypothetical protein